MHVTVHKFIAVEKMSCAYVLHSSLCITFLLLHKITNIVALKKHTHTHLYAHSSASPGMVWSCSVPRVTRLCLQLELEVLLQVYTELLAEFSFL